MSSARKFDVILYGATGFTGKLTARYLDKLPDLAGRRWAIAGRTSASLEKVRATLTSPGVEVVEAQLTDDAAVEAMVESARVVISAAGPWSTHDGDRLLGACARAGTHYSDLSGESFWQREMIDRFDAVARASGAKLVLGGGVDSMPSDVGAHLALAALRPAVDETVNVRGVCTEFSGTISGGSYATARANRRAERDGRFKEDPYILAPELDGDGCDAELGTADGMPRGFSRSLSGAFGALTSFFMAPINAPVVRRSLALRGLASRVSYAECAGAGLWVRALWLLASRGFGYPLGAPINWKPASGEGPPDWVIEQGAFTFHVTATAASGRAATATIAGRGDPGYGATARIFSQVALCLAHDSVALPEGGGVLTPSTALGDAFVDRLRRADGGDSFSITVQAH